MQQKTEWPFKSWILKFILQQTDRYYFFEIHTYAETNLEHVQTNGERTLMMVVNILCNGACKLFLKPSTLFPVKLFHESMYVVFTFR